jgi:hypothetical protein
MWLRRHGKIRVAIALYIFLFYGFFTHGETKIEVAPSVPPGYAAALRWPTSQEKEKGNATVMEIQDDVQSFDRWTRRILRPEFIPSNLAQIVFGIKKWEEGKNDVLFAEYQNGGYRIRISDTPTTFVIVAGLNGISGKVTNWDKFLSDNLIGFLEGSERLKSYRTLYITEIEGQLIYRVQLVLPEASDDIGELSQRDALYAELWHTGNPTFWVNPKAVIIEVGKVCVDPIDKDLGVGQRFPPLRMILKNAPLEELIRYATDERNSSERLVAIELLCGRPDAKNSIPALISAYKNAKEENFKIETIQTLMVLAKKYRGVSINKVKECATADVSQPISYRLRNVLENVIRDLEAERKK